MGIERKREVPTIRHPLTVVQGNEKSKQSGALHCQAEKRNK